MREAGFEVVNLELIKTEVLDDLSEFENLVSRLDGYDAVFFTSPVAAAVFVDRVAPRLEPILYALGKRATDVLVDAGFAVRTIFDANTADDMLAAFGEDEFAGKKLLFVGGERSMRTIPETLGSIADVDEVVVYKTVEIETANDTKKSVASSSIEWICFFSPSAVEAFEKRYGAGVRVAAIGETTARRARELGFDVELIASRATNEVFAQELTERLKAESDYKQE